jgi:hypothetical protein
VNHTCAATPIRSLPPVTDEVRITRRSNAHVALLCAAVLLGASAAQADRPTFTARPEIGVQAGTETFEFSANLADQAAGLSATASSKLTYPVATVLAGGTLRTDIGPVSLSATALTNLVNPWGNLVDQDFLAVSNGSAASGNIEFSHTDSRTTMRSLVFDVAARLRVAALGPEPGATTVHLVGGFRFESSVYDAYGAWGWQLDANANRVPVSLPGDPLGLHYEVRHRLPFVGVGLQFGTGKRFVLTTEARLFPSWSSHDDDHILRHKAAHAAAHGVGLGLSAEPGIDLGAGANVQVILGLSGQIQYVTTVDGRIQQAYYADDPSIPGNQLGDPIPDADFSSTSLRARLLAFLSVRF